MDAEGAATLAALGRVKIEVRPMLLIEAQAETEDGPRSGAVFLQNAETIRSPRPTARP